LKNLSMDATKPIVVDRLERREARDWTSPFGIFFSLSGRPLKAY